MLCLDQDVDVIDDKFQYYECGDSCYSIWTPCNGKCIWGTKLCGTTTCIPEDSFGMYWECGDECISTHQACNGTCPEGRSRCGNDSCLLFQDCNGSCQVDGYVACETPY